MEKPSRVKLLVTAERSRLDRYSHTGEVIVSVDGKQVCTLDFIVDEGNQITVVTLNTEKIYQHCGYASIAMEAIFGLARTLEVPVSLTSAANAVRFYEKLGFRRVKNSWKGIEPDGNPNDDNVVWLPQCLYRRRHIKIHV